MLAEALAETFSLQMLRMQSRIMFFLPRAVPATERAGRRGAEAACLKPSIEAFQYGIPS